MLQEYGVRRLLLFCAPKGRRIGGRLPPILRAGLGEECATARPVSHVFRCRFMLKGPGRRPMEVTPLPRFGPSEGRLASDNDNFMTLNRTTVTTHGRASAYRFFVRLGLFARLVAFREEVRVL